MQDLGKIVIDVREGGGGGIPSSGVGEYVSRQIPPVIPQVASATRGGNALVGVGDLQTFVRDIVRTGTDFRGQVRLIGNGLSNSVGGMSSTMIVAGVAIGASIVAVGAAVLAVKKMIDAFSSLNRFVMDFAHDIRDYSPAVQMAEMSNEIAMTMMRFRMGMGVGGAVASQVQQAGRIERSLFQIRTYAAAIGSQFLVPITKMLADILEQIAENLPNILAFLQGLIKGLGDMMTSIADGVQGMFMMFATPWLGPLMKLLGTYLQGFAASLGKIERNTAPTDMAGINKPFMDDIRLMTGRAI